MADGERSAPWDDDDAPDDGLFLDLLATVDYRPNLPVLTDRRRALMLNLDWLDVHVGLSDRRPATSVTEEEITDRIPAERLEHLRRTLR